MEELYLGINDLFKKFFGFSEVYLECSSVKKSKTTSLPEDLKFLMENQLPEYIKKNFFIENSSYICDGSIGKGAIAKTPWIAILNRFETDSPQRGVYLVFLISSDCKKVYLVLEQGITNGKLGKSFGLKKLREESELKRKLLGLSSSAIDTPDKLDVSKKEFSAGAIAYAEWDTSKDNSLLLIQFMDLYVKYLNIVHPEEHFKNPLVNNCENLTKEPGNGNEFEFSFFTNSIEQTNLIYPTDLLKRYVLSLLTKPFVILSGLAGSGKTQLALAFAKWIVEDQDKQIAFVPVGADWTNRDALLGYPNGLNNKEYVKPENMTLDVIIRANNDPDKPYFLILDEMNLSYVERYFADFLSAMEAHEKISLWQDSEDSEIPAQIYLPSNLFIIGTINVDETTYMFSPKVLDRANVIEFKISTEQMTDFLNHNVVGNQKLDSLGKNQASSFVKMATQEADNLSDKENEALVSMLISNFKELKKVNAEFGFRCAREIYRFVALGKSKQFDLTDNELFDFAIVQKLLPKLHGSRKKLTPVLQKLWSLCFENNPNDGLTISRANLEQPASPVKLRYPLSADKILRMYEAATANGFTSFAEA